MKMEIDAAKRRQLAQTIRSFGRLGAAIAEDTAAKLERETPDLDAEEREDADVSNDVLRRQNTWLHDRNADLNAEVDRLQLDNEARMAELIGRHRESLRDQGDKIGALQRSNAELRAERDELQRQLSDVEARAKVIEERARGLDSGYAIRVFPAQPEAGSGWSGAGFRDGVRVTSQFAQDPASALVTAVLGFAYETKTEEELVPWVDSFRDAFLALRHSLQVRKGNAGPVG